MDNMSAERQSTWAYGISCIKASWKTATNKVATGLSVLIGLIGPAVQLVTKADAKAAMTMSALTIVTVIVGFLVYLMISLVNGAHEKQKALEKRMLHVVAKQLCGDWELREDAVAAYAKPCHIKMNDAQELVFMSEKQADGRRRDGRGRVLEFLPSGEFQVIVDFGWQNSPLKGLLSADLRCIDWDQGCGKWTRRGSAKAALDDALYKLEAREHIGRLLEELTLLHRRLAKLSDTQTCEEYQAFLQRTEGYLQTLKDNTFASRFRAIPVGSYEERTSAQMDRLNEFIAELKH